MCSLDAGLPGFNLTQGMDVSVCSPGLYHRTDIIQFFPLSLRNPRKNKQLWYWRLSFIAFSFRLAETIFTGTRTQELFWDFRDFLQEYNAEIVNDSPMVYP